MSRDAIAISFVLIAGAVIAQSRQLPTSPGLAGTSWSLHDQIVKQWGFIRSYVMRGGHLFLALMADGGIYEFEPVLRR